VSAPLAADQSPGKQQNRKSPPLGGPWYACAGVGVAVPGDAQEGTPPGTTREGRRCGNARRQAGGDDRGRTAWSRGPQVDTCARLRRASASDCGAWGAVLDHPQAVGTTTPRCKPRPVRTERGRNPSCAWQVGDLSARLRTEPRLAPTWALGQSSGPGVALRTIAPNGRSSLTTRVGSRGRKRKSPANEGRALVHLSPLAIGPAIAAYASTFRPRCQALLSRRRSGAPPGHRWRQRAAEAMSLRTGDLRSGTPERHRPCCSR
jgi:hypothetical protein